MVDFVLIIDPPIMSTKSTISQKLKIANRGVTEAGALPNMIFFLSDFDEHFFIPLEYSETHFDL